MLSIRILFWALWYRALFKTTPFHKLIKDLSTIKQPAGVKKTKDKMKIVSVCNVYLDTFFATDSCLVRSFIKFRVLKSEGFHPVLKIGVKRNFSLLSHAWIDLDGECIDKNDEIADYKIINEIT